jgi:hypothetical protein
MPTMLPSLERLLPALLLACAGAGVQAQNLIQNPGNELELVGGEIPGWTEVQGSQWGQRASNPLPQEGAHYFFAGAVASALLRQDVDVSALAPAIDAGQMAFDFSGWARSFAQSPADTSTFLVTLLDAQAATTLDYSSGALSSTDSWQQVQTRLLAPAGTRTVRIDLLATRLAGSNNDGYFDDLRLVAAPVPEPASAWLMAAGCLVWLASRRPRRRAA